MWGYVTLNALRKAVQNRPRSPLFSGYRPHFAPQSASSQWSRPFRRRRTGWGRHRCSGSYWCLPWMTRLWSGCLRTGTLWVGLLLQLWSAAGEETQIHFSIQRCVINDWKSRSNRCLTSSPSEGLKVRYPHKYFTNPLNVFPPLINHVCFGDLYLEEVIVRHERR